MANAPSAQDVMDLVQQGYDPKTIAILIRDGGWQGALSQRNDFYPQKSQRSSLGGGIASSLVSNGGLFPTLMAKGLGLLPTNRIAGTPTRAPQSNTANLLGQTAQELARTLGGNNSLGARVGSQIGGNGLGIGLRLGNGSSAKQDTPQGISDPGLGGMPGLDLPQFQAPQFQIRDFTDQANQQAASAYGPQYAAIDAAKQTQQGQYQRSDKIVAGLYQNLVDSLAKRAVETKDQYQQAGEQQKAATSDLQKEIADTYNSSAQQQAALMGQLGIQEAAPAVLKQGTGDSNFQQGQAALQGNAQGNAIAQQGQGQQDYARNVQNAEETQGTVAREGLLHDLSTVLAQYDQQRLGIAGDQSRTALDLAQNLSNQDFQLQQANYGGYRDS